MTLPETAILLAAGRGKRMGSLTDNLPKPLIPVEGKTLIDYGLDRLAQAGVKRVVVNLCYLGEAIASHLSSRRDVTIEFSREETALETGGGVKKALPLLGETFFVLNADILWFDGSGNALQRLASEFDAQKTDALLLMQRASSAVGYDGLGDFLLDPMGLVRRRPEREIAPYVFAGVEIVHRRLFDDAPDGAFSINQLWNKALGQDRLKGMVHDGAWFHIGTPAGKAAAEARLRGNGHAEI